jgi:hypothetical protein
MVIQRKSTLTTKMMAMHPDAQLLLALDCLSANLRLLQLEKSALVEFRCRPADLFEWLTPKSSGNLSGIFIVNMVYHNLSKGFPTTKARI